MVLCVVGITLVSRNVVLVDVFCDLLYHIGEFLGLLSEVVEGLCEPDSFDALEYSWLVVEEEGHWYL